MVLEIQDTHLPLLTEEEKAILSKLIDELSIEELFSSIQLRSRLSGFGAKAALELMLRQRKEFN